MAVYFRSSGNPGPSSIRATDQMDPRFRGGDRLSRDSYARASVIPAPALVQTGESGNPARHGNMWTPAFAGSLPPAHTGVTPSPPVRGERCKASATGMP